MKDPIVEEVRETAEKIAKECDYDIQKYSKRLRENQKEHKSRIVTKKDVEKVRKEQAVYEVEV